MLSREVSLIMKDSEARPFRPGDDVWIVCHDECDVPVEVVGEMLIAVVNDYAITCDYIYGCEDDVDSVLDYERVSTSTGLSSDLHVHPLGDCYHTEEQADAELEKERAEFGESEDDDDGQDF